MDCPHCNATVEDGARFCAACGRTVTPEGDRTAVLDAVAAPGSATDATTPATAPSGELRRCPSCGADNSAGRVLCARCGVDLDSGERPVAAQVLHRPGPPVDVAGEVVADPPRSRSRTPMLVGAIIVVGAVVGVVAGLLLVGSGDGPEAAAPVFDPGVYPEEPAPLEVAAVGASSQRAATGDTTYGAENLVDDDVTTAWSHDPAVEAAADVDLALRLAEPAWVTSLTFANGAQSDDLAFTADGRILRLSLLVGGDAAAELQLLDQQGLQRVTLPEPVLVETIRLVVLEAVPGDTYDEVSLSEIVLTGHVARGEDLARIAAVDDGDPGGTA